MGINLKTYHWIKKNIHNRKKISFGVIGKQNLNMNNRELKSINYKKKKSLYADELLKDTLNIMEVTSYDIHPHEKANHICDFNKKIISKKKYDFFFDGGSLQHIYNVPQALVNIINFTKINGIVLHSVVFNNFQGFGLYQFSPEIFFKIYSKKNGFKNTQIYLATNSDNKYWYKILRDKLSHNYLSNDQLTLFISTQKVRKENISHIMQGLYSAKKAKVKIYKNNLKIKFFLYLKGVLISIFPNFFLNFQNNLKKIKI